MGWFGKCLIGAELRLCDRSYHCGNQSAHQSALTPARLTTAAHFALSLRMNAPNCSGVPLMGSEPMASTFSLYEEDAAIWTISAFNRVTTARGMPTGATMPVQVVAS